MSRSHFTMRNESSLRLRGKFVLMQQSLEQIADREHDHIGLRSVPASI